MRGLRLKEIEAGYGGVSLLRKINVEVAPGEMMALLGANGSGKSTLLKTVVGLLPPVSGEVFLGGQALNRMSEKERARCMSVFLPEDPKREHVSCREVVELGRYPYTGGFGLLSAKDRQVVAEAMARTGVEELAEVDYCRISDGQRQRVRLARALAQEPEILILDEPTVFLDICFQLRFLALLKSLTKEKKMAVLLSLHDMEQACCTADRLLCLKDGGIYACGTVEEVTAGGALRGLYGLDGLQQELGEIPAMAAYIERLGRG